MVSLLKDYNLGCHGIPERCFRIKGQPMNFCARCLGACIGHIVAVINYFTFPMLSVWLAPLGLIIMFGDWYLQNKKKLYHNNISRLLTGIIGGYSVGLLIWQTVDKIIELIGK